MAYGQRICRTLAAALLASAPLVAWQAPPPRLTWYETVGSALGLAEVQPTEIADQAPVQSELQGCRREMDGERLLRISQLLNERRQAKHEVFHGGLI